jgi:hypothetical protein
MAELYSECLEAAFTRLGRPFGNFSEYPLRRFFEYEYKLLRGPIGDDDTTNLSAVFGEPKYISFAHRSVALGSKD